MFICIKFQSGHVEATIRRTRQKLLMTLTHSKAADESQTILRPGSVVVGEIPVIFRTILPPEAAGFKPQNPCESNVPAPSRAAEMARYTREIPRVISLSGEVFSSVTI